LRASNSGTLPPSFEPAGRDALAVEDGKHPQAASGNRLTDAQVRDPRRDLACRVAARRGPGIAQDQRLLRTLLDRARPERAQSFEGSGTIDASRG
jgi:hypothetical protein